MPIPTEGYTQGERNIGGFGKVAVHNSPLSGCRLSMVTVGATADGESHLYLGGFRIGTATFGPTRAIYAFVPAMTNPTLATTIWEGVPAEVAEEGDTTALVFHNFVESSSIPTLSESEMIIGGGVVSLDADRRILCYLKGAPDETKKAIIGSKHITVGRFGDAWALALYPTGD